MWIIQETGVALAALPPDTYVRDVAANSLVVSYWRTAGGVLPVPINPNTLHFTLGVITGDTAYFHATNLGGGSVTYYRCRANPVTGVLATTHDHANPLNVGPNATQARAQAIAPIIYKALEIDDVKFKQGYEKLKAARSSHFKTNIATKRSVVGAAFRDIGAKSKK